MFNSVTTKVIYSQAHNQTQNGVCVCVYVCVFV